MTRIRDRSGITSFRSCFEAIVERCQDDGLIWCKELYADATLVEAHADRDNTLPRCAVEAHLRQLFGDAYQSPDSVEDSVPPSETPTPPAPQRAAKAHQPTRQIGTELPPERRAELLAHQQTRPDWYAQNGEPDRSIKRGGYQRTSDLWASLSDPDAVLMRQHNTACTYAIVIIISLMGEGRALQPGDGRRAGVQLVPELLEPARISLVIRNRG